MRLIYIENQASNFYDVNTLRHAFAHLDGPCFLNELNFLLDKGRKKKTATLLDPREIL